MRGHRKKEKESEYEKGKSCVEKEDEKEEKCQNAAPYAEQRRRM